MTHSQRENLLMTYASRSAGPATKKPDRLYLCFDAYLLIRQGESCFSHRSYFHDL